MQLSDKIRTIYPELDPFCFINRTIVLKDDGNGAYIAEWNYHKPQPTQEQLDAIE